MGKRGTGSREAAPHPRSDQTPVEQEMIKTGRGASASAQGAPPPALPAPPSPQGPSPRCHGTHRDPVRVFLPDLLAFLFPILKRVVLLVLELHGGAQGLSASAGACLPRGSPRASPGSRPDLQVAIACTQRKARLRERGCTAELARRNDLRDARLDPRPGPARGEIPAAAPPALRTQKQPRARRCRDVTAPRPRPAPGAAHRGGGGGEREPRCSPG